MLEACTYELPGALQASAEEFARLYNRAQAITGPVLVGGREFPDPRCSTDSGTRRGWRCSSNRSTCARALSCSEASASESISATTGSSARCSRSFARTSRATASCSRPRTSNRRWKSSTGRRPGAPRPVSAQRHGLPVEPTLLRSQGRQAHLRIENRVLPAGPTVLDQVANAAFYDRADGLVGRGALRHLEGHGLRRRAGNFVAAARYGLNAQFRWTRGRAVPARELVLEHLLPLAREGLRRQEIDAADIEALPRDPRGAREEAVARERSGRSTRSRACLAPRAPTSAIARSPRASRSVNSPPGRYTWSLAPTRRGQRLAAQLPHGRSGDDARRLHRASRDVDRSRRELDGVGAASGAFQSRTTRAISSASSRSAISCGS